jgi:hypothetical protein
MVDVFVQMDGLLGLGFRRAVLTIKVRLLVQIDEVLGLYNQDRLFICTGQ